MIALPAADDTVAFGERLGRTLRAGDLVLLAGPLGAGKTVLVKGIAAGMDVAGQVSSPTFVIARVHRPTTPDGIPLVHVDAYRLGDDLDQLAGLDLDTDLMDAAVVVEWGEGVAQALSSDFLLVRMTRRDDDVREVVLEPHGTWADRKLPSPV